MPTVTYSVQAFPGGNRCQSVQSSSCTVTGLLNGTSYFFQINTSNGVYSAPVITTGESTPLATLRTTTTTALIPPSKVTSATTTTTIKKPVTTTINCYKGKLLKKVTAVKPVCPAGYKKK